jgi:hypothetical protein
MNIKLDKEVATEQTFQSLSLESLSRELPAELAMNVREAQRIYSPTGTMRGSCLDLTSS